MIKDSSKSKAKFKEKRLFLKEEVSKIIIGNSEDEKVTDNIVDKGVDYDVVAIEVVDDNTVVSNDNVGATKKLVVI